MIFLCAFIEFVQELLIKKRKLREMHACLWLRIQSRILEGEKVFNSLTAIGMFLLGLYDPDVPTYTLHSHHSIFRV